MESVSERWDFNWDVHRPRTASQLSLHWSRSGWDHHKPLTWGFEGYVDDVIAPVRMFVCWLSEEDVCQRSIFLIIILVYKAIFPRRTWHSNLWRINSAPRLTTGNHLLIRTCPPALAHGRLLVGLHLYPKAKRQRETNVLLVMNPKQHRQHILNWSAKQRGQSICRSHQGKSSSVSPPLPSHPPWRMSRASHRSARVSISII